ncbi:MAG: beta-hydroxyacyl-ACP dehydratase [Planctomycetota bacterium]
MRWIWLDRIVELEPKQRLVAVKSVSAAEDVLHHRFPEAPRGGPACLPHSLIIEGMAQAAGVLVGHAGAFQEKVILAKIGAARFTGVLAEPGYTLRFEALLERFDSTGASAKGHVDRIDPLTSETQRLADIELLFSHVDQNRAGLEFPEENFVFTDQFMDLLRRFSPEAAQPAQPVESDASA